MEEEEEITNNKREAGACKRRSSSFYILYNKIRNTDIVLISYIRQARRNHCEPNQLALVHMMLNVIFGGKGMGLVTILIYAMLTVFISGLMVGRTPEFLGKKLEEFDEKDKIPANIVHGCTSQVWLTYEIKDGKMYFHGTSDAIIVKGLVFMILEIFSDSTIQELKDIDMDIVHELNLSEVITPNRQSGVIGMMKKIKEYALNA